MELRFGDKEVTVRLQKGFDLLKEFGGIWHFVNHPESEGEIDRACHAKIVWGTGLGLDARFHTRSRSAFPENGQHLMLEIDSNDPAMAADETSHADGKEPHAAADVKYGHCRSNICLEYLVRVMEDAPQDVVEQVGVSPGTHVAFQDEAPWNEEILFAASGQIRPAARRHPFFA